MNALAAMNAPMPRFQSGGVVTGHRDTVPVLIDPGYVVFSSRTHRELRRAHRPEAWPELDAVDFSWPPRDYHHVPNPPPRCPFDLERRHGGVL